MERRRHVCGREQHGCSPYEHRGGGRKGAGKQTTPTPHSAASVAWVLVEGVSKGGP